MQNLMTFEQLQAHYQQKKHLNECEAVLVNVSALHSHGDTEDISEALAALQEEASALKKQVEANASRVSATLKAIRDVQAYLVCSLHYRSGYDWETIGRILKRSSSAVRKRAERALNKLLEQEK